jgi:hypothetical protein
VASEVVLHRPMSCVWCAAHACSLRKVIYAGFQDTYKARYAGSTGAGALMSCRG